MEREVVLQIVAALAGGAAITFFSDLPIAIERMGWTRYIVPPLIILLVAMYCMKDGDYDFSDRVLGAGLLAHIVMSLVLIGPRQNRYLEGRRQVGVLDPLPVKGSTPEMADEPSSPIADPTMYDYLDNELKRER